MHYFFHTHLEVIFKLFFKIGTSAYDLTSRMRPLYNL